MPIVKRLWAVVEPVFRATVHFHRDRCFDRATVIAYFGLLSFLPLAVFLVTIGALAFGTDAAEKGTELFFQNLLYRMPPQLMTQVRSLQSHVWSGVGYLVLVLWTASKVFSKVESGLDHVFRVDKRRPFALRKLFAIALVGLMSVVLVATVVMEGLMGTVDRFIDTTALAPLKTLPLYQVLDTFLSRTVIPWSLTVFVFCRLLAGASEVHSVAGGSNRRCGRRNAVEYLEGRLHLLHQPPRELHPDVRCARDPHRVPVVDQPIRVDPPVGRRARRGGRWIPES